MRIAVAQTPGTRLEQWRETLTLIEGVVSRAASLRAELVVLPECVWPAYVLGSKSAYRAARDTGLPDHEVFLEGLRRQARRCQIAICAGYVEETPGGLANAACFIDSGGTLLGVHRKCFLWDFDHACFEAGVDIKPIDAGSGRVGLMICADARLPEIPATLAARGANLIVQPTGWVNTGAPDQLRNPQPEFLISARAREFGIPIASASKWGVEGTTTFVGSSLICDAEGNTLVRCGPEETTVVAADVEWTAPRPPCLAERQREILLATRALANPAGPAPSASLLLLPACANPAQLDARRQQIRERYVQCAICVSRAAGRANVHVVNHLHLSGPAEEAFELGAARVAAVSDADARGFAPIRCHALCGVHLVVVFGDDVADVLVRARACENRIFVVWARAAGASVIDPHGQVVVENAWPRTLAGVSEITLDLSAAVDKCVTQGTDVIAGRRPAQYVF